MKTLYLHIGTPKTGTSSIQAFLRKNRKLLAKRSYGFPLMPFTYPSVPIQRNGHFLMVTSPFLEKTSSDSYAAPPKTNERWKKNYSEGLATLHREFESYDNVILSEERLWNAIYYDPISFLSFLPEDAAANNYCIKIVVYLRRQDLFLTSLWNQRVKATKSGETLPEYLDNLAVRKPLYADYEQTLQTLSDVFGTENIIVRRFEPDSWIDHSLTTDFLAAIGMDYSLRFQPPKHTANPSLNGNALEIQRLINRSELLSNAEKLDLSTYMKAIPESTQAGRAYQHLSVEESAALLANYREGNNRVAEIYLRDGLPLFSDEIRETPMWQQENKEMLADTMRLFLTVTHDQYVRNQNLIKENNALNKEVKKLQVFREKVQHPARTIKNKIFKNR
ncbi:MAG: hypothetical protein LUD18_04970 [Lachnospiraceae bacterium]|nr:hypothetical protein [Lachnospiraceae bacterium]